MGVTEQQEERQPQQDDDRNDHQGHSCAIGLCGGRVSESISFCDLLQRLVFQVNTSQGVGDSSPGGPVGLQGFVPTNYPG